MRKSLRQIRHYCQFFAQYYLRTSVCSYPPLTVMIEPTNSCNLCCPVCAYPDMNREQGVMGLDTFKKIIDNNHRMLNRLWLYYIGESLLCADLPQMISYARKLHISVKVNTNATLLTEEMSLSLIHSGLNAISFSFEVTDEEFYRITRGNVDFEATLENIKRFLKLRNHHQANTTAYIEMIDSGKSGKELAQHLNGLSELGVDRINVVPLHAWPGQKNGAYNNEQAKRLPRGKYQHCIMPWAMLGILWDGRVVGCCDDFDAGYVVGDVNRTPDLMEIWNNDKMVQLRKSLAERKHTAIPTCRHCEKVWTTSFGYPINEYLARELCELKNRFIKRKHDAQ